jgi:serine/threonine protein kinase/tetratricopeptide (TPR) repeat protein
MSHAISEPLRSNTADPALAALIDELTDRLHASESVDPESFLLRHPEHAEALRQLIPALELMGELKRSGSREQPFPSAHGLDPRLEVGVLGDFRIVREIGRGGMGVVYEARQLSLDRRVALKVLPLAAALDSKQLQRFRLEAHAAACLHHTNIVPIHAVGCENGVPFYAMQFIEGRSLAQVIEELRRLERRDGRDRRVVPKAARPEASLSPDPMLATIVSGSLQGHVVQAEAPAVHDEQGTRSASEAGSTILPAGPVGSTGSSRNRAFIRTVAQLGVQVAEALDHAHTRGILHRDIKPANLLLGEQGQLWVTDFGLAQVQGNPGLTLTGDILGTLRYMSPEQALAKHVVIDGRTDIYSLGVTLYELLTLRPAIDGTDRAEILRKIAQEEPVPVRRLNSAIPRDLETIVLKAICKEPGGRYSTAKELADELCRFLDCKPIKARRPSVFDRASKVARRHRPVVLTAALGLLAAGAILAGCLGWIVRDQAARRAMTEQEVTRALEESTRLQRQAKWREALEAAKRADGLLVAGATQSLHQRVQESLMDVNMVLRLEGIWLPRAHHGSEGKYDNHWADASYSEAFREYGIDVDALEPAEAARRIHARPIRLELAVALDSWADRRRKSLSESEGGGDGRPDLPDHSPVTSDSRWRRLIRVSRAADPDEWRDLVRAALERRDRETLNKLASSARISELPAPLLSVVCGHIDNEYGAPALRRTQIEHPGDFWINFQLAWMSQDLDEVIRFYTAALAARPRSAPTACFLGNALHSRGRLDEAIALYRKAIALDPEGAWAYTRLVEALRACGKRDEAVVEIRAAIAARPNDALLHNNLGWKLATTADSRFRDPGLAVELAKRAVELDPQEGMYWNTLGAAQFRAGNGKGAKAALEKSMALRKGGDGYDWFFLAMASWQLGLRDEARAWYDQAVHWINTSKNENEELRRFRAEADTLLRTGAATQPGMSGR